MKLEHGKNGSIGSLHGSIVVLLHGVSTKTPQKESLSLLVNLGWTNTTCSLKLLGTNNQCDQITNFWDFSQNSKISIYHYSWEGPVLNFARRELFIFICCAQAKSNFFFQFRKKMNLNNFVKFCHGVQYLESYMMLNGVKFSDIFNSIYAKLLFD